MNVARRVILLARGRVVVPWCGAGAAGAADGGRGAGTHAGVRQIERGHASARGGRSPRTPPRPTAPLASFHTK